MIAARRCGYLLKLPLLGKRRFISVGATKSASLFEPSLAMVKSLFKVLDITYAGELLFPEVDEKGAIAKYPGPKPFLPGRNNKCCPGANYTFVKWLS